MPPRPNSKLMRLVRLAVVLAWCSAGALAHAFYLISPLSYWPASSVAGNVTFQVGLVANPPNIPNPPLQDGSASWDAAFVAQLNAWNAVLPDAVLNLAAVVGSAAVPVEGDGVNNVFFSSTVYGDTWGTSTAGICLSFWSGNERTEADILFNSTKTWNSYTGNLQGNLTDFRRVALHELGHALLLDHPDDVGQSVAAIMNSTSSNTDALTADDIAGVTAVFGALTPVSITQFPSSIMTNSGANAAFRVTAVGSEPMTYAWERSTNNGSSWSAFGLNAPAFTFGPFNAGADGNLFRVTVTNPAGAVTSSTMMLIVSGGATQANISLHPADAAITEGEAVIFTSHAAGSPTPTYQWQYSSNDGANWQNMFSSFGPTDVTGINSATLKISQTLGQMDGYQFRVVVTNSAGSDTSDAATLTVAAGGPAPYFTWQPLDVVAQSTATAMFVAGVDGSPAPTRQWQRSINGGSSWSNVTNDATFSGATTSTLTITAVTTGMSGHLFRLAATNGSGTTNSRSAALSVGAAAATPTILDQPDDLAVASGATGSFAARVTALPAAVFQWQASPDGVSYSSLQDGLLPVGTILLSSVVTGAQTRTLTIANVDESLADFQFRLLVTNAAGSVTTVPATLTIGAGGTAPSITTQPGNAARLVGEDATFSAAATGSPAPGLQWQRSTNGGGAWGNLSNDATFSGVTTGTLTVNNVTLAMNGHQFRAIASNGVAPDANTNAATLTVTQAPAITTQPANTTKQVAEVATFTAAAATGSPTPTLQWQRSTNGGGTWANLTNVSPFSGVTSGTLTINGVTLAMTGHRFRLIATNTAGNATSNAAILTVNATPTPPAAPAVPTVGTTTYDSFTAQWAAVSGATGYEIDVATDAGFTAFVTGYQDLDLGNVTSRALTGLRLGTYYVRVRAYNANGTSTSSTSSSIAVGSRLLNLSTRGQSSAGNPMIVGFYVSGPPKTLLIRVAAAALAELGVPGTLANPRLRLVNGANATLATNDDWNSTDPAVIAAVIASGAGLQFEPGSVDSVLVATDLAPGGYTAVVETVDGTSGVVLVELYEINQTGRLINISTRGLTVTAGADVMIPGTYIGPTSKRLLIRVAGEALDSLLPGALLDPILEIYDGDLPQNSPPIVINDNWDGNDAALVATWTAGHPNQVAGLAFAAGSRDAAVLVVLPKNNGGYTVLAKGKNGASGTVLVEVYEVP